LQEKEKSLIEEIKKQCIPKILNLFDDITWIKKETRILSKDLDKSGLFLKYNDMITDDCFIGKYNNISFSVSEIKLIKENMFHDKIKFNIFSGIVFLFHLDKYVKNRTIATAKREFLINSVHFIDVATFMLILIFIYKNIDFGCALLDIKIIFTFLILIIAICVIIYFEVSTRIKEEKLDKIILEDPQFNKKYNAYSSDQIEGRCILTTAFIERFQNLQTAFNSKNIKCSFYSNKLMIAISTNKNLFEICNINKSFKNTKDILEFYKQISSIYHIIDYFKLDKKV